MSLTPLDERIADWIHSISDGFDWYDGDQYGVCILLKEIQVELARLRKELSGAVELQLDK